MSKKLKITQLKSTIGKLEAQKRTMRALGIKRIRDSAMHNDTSTIRGMIDCVKHLVKVEEVITE